MGLETDQDQLQRKKFESLWQVELTWYFPVDGRQLRNLQLLKDVPWRSYLYTKNFVLKQL